MFKLSTCFSVALAARVLALDQDSRSAEAAATLAQMPVREITIFKDGHALLLHSGTLPTDSSGQVRLDYLPAPVLGTFWPFCNDPEAELQAVVAGQRPVTVERTAINMSELLIANIGAAVQIEETSGTRVSGALLAWPTRGAAELQQTNPPNGGPLLPQTGDVVLLDTPDGVRVVPVAQIQRVTFKSDYRPLHRTDELRDSLTLRLARKGGSPQPTAAVGVMYLQKGVRWIPNYRVTIDGKGNARVELQATLVNELTDLEDVTANLVIGVPSFLFADTPDPIGFQGAVAQLSQHFAKPAQTGAALADALRTQARMGEFRAMGEAADVTRVPQGPEISDAERNEDLFVFTVQHVTLRKGERMVLPVAEFELPYGDVFTLDVPFAPPPELRAQINMQVPPEFTKMLMSPKVYHALRLTNTSKVPLTTAPALIMSAGNLLAQGMMTYAAPGADVDLRITAAVDVRVEKTDREQARVPNAVEWQGNHYGRLDLTGRIVLTNFRPEAVTVEVTRHVLGNIDNADRDGTIERVNAFEDWSFLPASQGLPYGQWWNWHAWPYWWHHFNGVGRIRWTASLAPGEKAELNYSWHYFWR